MQRLVEMTGDADIVDDPALRLGDLEPARASANRCSKLRLTFSFSA